MAKVAFLRNFIRLSALLIPVLCAENQVATPQEPAPNYDETKIPAYALPDPLITADGRKVSDPVAWLNERRPEIMALFETEVYGRTPSLKADLAFSLSSLDTNALDGRAIRKEVVLRISREDKDLSMIILIYLPKVSAPVPVLLGLNFEGNHTIHDDPGIAISESWKAREHQRGQDSLSWPVKMIIDRGFGLATLYYGDIDPDFDDGFRNGIHPLFYEPGQIKPHADEWGSIGAWAWGLSRTADYLVTDPAIDPGKLIVMGHSRLGKAALWAGAQDNRFAVVISNNSGCGGAALSKRIFGETVGAINGTFPHWFCRNFHQYSHNEAALPVDQHMLVALIAPRPVYIASAVEDLWADPKGEFLGAFFASPVYRLLGTDGLSATDQPPLNKPVMSTLGYHVRSGGHDITSYDWNVYMDFAEKHF